MVVKIGGVYQHFKGNLYLVEDIVINSDTDKEMVLYRALYGEGKRFVRETKTFVEKLDKQKYPNAKQEYRFKLLKINNISDGKE